MKIAELTRIACFLLVAASAAASCREAPPDPEALVRRGGELMRAERYGEAAAAFRAAVESAPRDGHARLKLADALLRTGDWSKAAAETIRAADLLPDDQEVQVHAAALLLSQTRFIDARDRAAAVLEKSPDHVGALIVWATANAELQFPHTALLAFHQALRDGQPPDRFVHQRRARYIPAERDVRSQLALARALAAAPDDLIAYTALANVLFAAGRYAEAEPHLRRVAGAPLPGAWRYLPYDPTAWAPKALGEWFAYSGRTEEGEKYLRRALEVGDEAALIPLADHVARAGRAAEALDLLGRASEQLDAGGDVSVRVARIHAHAGRGDEAMRRLEQLLSRQPKHGPALLLKAQMLRDLGRLDEALPVARAAADSLSSGEARVVLAQALIATGDAATAFNELIEATRTDPDAPRLYVELTRAALALGRDKEAVVFAGDAVRRIPEDRDVRLLLARALTRTRAYAAADAEVKRLLARHPQWPPGLSQLGEVHAHRGNVAAARAAYTQALQMNPALYEAASGLIALELAAGRGTAARDVAQKALAASPDEPDYLLLAARAYDGSAEARRAEAALRQALGRNPGHAPATLFLADVLVRQRRVDEAIRLLQQFAAERPSALDVQMRLAETLDRAGRHADAQAQYEQIVARAPGHPAAVRLAELYLNRGQNLGKAVELALVARDQARDDPAINHLLGALYVKTNAAWQAIPYLQQALVNDPDNVRYRYALAFAYVKNGDITRGNRELRRALELDPTVPEAAEARAVLGGAALR